MYKHIALCILIGISQLAHGAAFAPATPLDPSMPQTTSFELFNTLLRQCVREAFFEQLAVVRKEHPDIADPRELITTALERVANDSRRSDADDIVFVDHFGLSILDLIEHDLMPTFYTRILDLSDMHIDDISGIRNVSRLSNVTELSLNNNLLRTVPSGTFAGLNLKDLFLHHNQLHTIAPDAFAGLNNLEYLDLNNNQLRSFPPDTFAHLHNLEYLYLDNNQLQALPHDAFAALHKLKFLFLNHNKLQTIAPRTFADLSNLKRLNLNNNQLQIIAPSAFAGLNKLRQLYFDNNMLAPTERARIEEEVRKALPNVIQF